MARAGNGTAGVTAFIRGLPLPLYLLPLLTFLIVPGVVAHNNSINVLGFPVWSWLALLLLSIAALVFIALFAWVVKDTSIGRVYVLLVSFSCYFAVCSGFFFSVSGHTGLLDPEDAPVDTANVLLCLLGAALMLVLFESRQRRLFHLGLVIFVLANVAVVISTSLIDIPQAEHEDVYAASTERNIFVLSFDGLSGSAMSEVLEEESFADVLSGFTVYESVSTSSPATSMSIAAELYGNQNFKEHATTSEDVFDHAPDELLTNVLAQNRFEVKTYGLYSTNLVDEGARIIKPGLIEQSSAALFRLSMARMFGRSFVPVGTAENLLFRVMRDPSVQPEADGLRERIGRSHSHGWAKDLTVSILDYERFVSELQSGVEDPAAFFLHFTHTHFPVEFDSGCNFRGDEWEWFASNQSFEGAKGEARCALGQFSAFLTKLEALGIFDESMVVLKSDHGKPPIFARPGGIQETTIHGHPIYGLARYAPFLAVKPFGPGEGEPLRWSDAPVMLDDLARTICEESEIEFECDTYPGYNILRDSDVIPTDDEVTVFVVTSETSDFRFETHQAVTITRGSDILQSLYDELLTADMVVRRD